MSERAMLDRLPSPPRSDAASPTSPALAEMPDVEVRAAFQDIDRAFHAALARWTGGIAPGAVLGAMTDWATHLALSPGKQMELASRFFADSWETFAYSTACLTGHGGNPCRCALPQDKRFRAPEWEHFPFNVLAHAFLARERWWEDATRNVRGVNPRHGEMVTFLVRQFLDAFAPSNFIATNPEVLAAGREHHGLNLVRGGLNALTDAMRALTQQPPVDAAGFEVGRTVAITRGKVVHRTRLAEIIQYAPETATVRPEPVVIVPAWIMKYYVLDLTPQDSLVKFLVAQGFTVFMVSWKNPTSADRDIGFDDYRTEGVLPAFDAALSITGAKKAHAVGYCLGGTLLAATAAAMARDHDDRLASLSLFAAQANFTEGGELMLFIDDAQVSFLEDMMWDRGYLDARQMAGTFQILRSNDLIWSRLIHHYLMGKPAVADDITAWSKDATRMPYRMHAEYLRSLFLDNDLAEGRMKLGGRPVAIEDVRVPLFIVSTEQDHIAPWRSVYKFHLLADTEITFVLTNRGHNAGIVAAPGKPGREYRIRMHARGESYLDPDAWLDTTPSAEGSWWPVWSNWLTERSHAPVAPPPLGISPFEALGDAPGTYVLTR